ncbi:uncharacterized protein LOC135202262 isoform X2 [Macrobrachium nipponense]|uniref:uncharacterized protein LOC135202262 isoform X2 n=1 Tax=Macrobrachium nipponense TaxID=159736 RepID=UPI0030C829A7
MWLYIDSTIEFPLQMTLTKKRSLMLLLFTTLLESFTMTSALSPYCRFTSLHTMCRHKGLGRTCGSNVAYRGVGTRDVERIVSLHNRYRSKVAVGMETFGADGPQPQAANMRLLEWDFELAQLAQSHADQCLFEHDCPDCRRVSRFGVGQNLCIRAQIGFNSTIDWEGVINTWYSEVELFSSDAIEPYRFSTATGRYSQMMWSSSYKVGCGFTMFLEGNWWKQLYTCDYGPAGNIISYQMYRSGHPCSSCPHGTTCSAEYPGLCVSATPPRLYPDWYSEDFTEDDFPKVSERTNGTSQESGFSELLMTLEDLESLEDDPSQILRESLVPEGAGQKMSVLGGGYEQGSLEGVRDEFTNLKGLFDALIGLQPPHYLVKYEPDSGSVDDDVEDEIFLSSYSGEDPTQRHKREVGLLLACDLDLLPCEFSVIGTDWIAGESALEGRYTYTVLEAGQKSVLNCNTKVAAPETGSICVVISHVRHMEADNNSTGEVDALPELLVDIRPVDDQDNSGEVVQNSLTGSNGIWETSSLTISDVTTSFFLVLTIGPATGRTTVAMNSLRVTDGACSGETLNK